MNPTTTRFVFECTDCGQSYHPEEVLYLCPVCSRDNTAGQPPRGVLKTLYDYHAIRLKIRNPDRALKHLKANSFSPLLPLRDSRSWPPLRVGDTPLYRTSRLDGNKLPFELFLKDDSQNPTFSFKDRASALVSAHAKERGLAVIVAASTGNAGSSIAGICAAQGQQAVVLVPEKAPLGKLTQIGFYGACLVPVRGTYDEAFELSIEASNAFGWYNRNTAYNPLTIEGKKTVSLELALQLPGQVPDRIFVPAGDGVILSGVYKGFEDLLQLGIIDKMPVVVAVQSDGSDNLIRNLDSEVFRIRASKTLADSISVDVPRNFLMARQFMHRYGGEGLVVTDQDILDASSRLSRNTGLFTEPASAAAFAGFLSYYRRERLEEGSVNVVLLTGSGLKDLQAVQQGLQVPAAIEPGLDGLKRIWERHPRRE